MSEDKITALQKIGAHANEEKSFSLPKLPYAFDAMEPFIDKQTMEIHYTKHHQAYVDKLNATPSTNIDFSSDDATKCSHIDKTTSAVIRNNLGGHYNHSLFWSLLKPNPEVYKNMAEGKLKEAINKEFKSFEEFQKQFADKALKVFGSGWCWLIEKNGKLAITTTPNQDNPLMNLDVEKGKIILCLDVWEHAYYLKYQNKRADYISNWWNVVNWNKAEELFGAK
ncbi:MAG: superoxide dismutase [Bacteroidetes bacterium]|nr:superoxide dismutase [Bacteroidota bacterium]